MLAVVLPLINEVTVRLIYPRLYLASSVLCCSLCVEMECRKSKGEVSKESRASLGNQEENSLEKAGILHVMPILIAAKRPQPGQLH